MRRCSTYMIVFYEDAVNAIASPKGVKRRKIIWQN